MVTKLWVARASECLCESLEPVPHGLNELDWKLGLSSQTLTNTTLRERFKLNERRRNQITNLIGDAVTAGRIKREDEGSGKKFAEYLPYWV